MLGQLRVRVLVRLGRRVRERGVTLQFQRQPLRWRQHGRQPLPDSERRRFSQINKRCGVYRD
jgi:hypothetical protein